MCIFNLSVEKTDKLNKLNNKLNNQKSQKKKPQPFSLLSYNILNHGYESTISCCWEKMENRSGKNKHKDHLQDTWRNACVWLGGGKQAAQLWAPSSQEDVDRPEQTWRTATRMMRGLGEGSLLERAEGLGLLVPRSREAVVFAAVSGRVKSG